MASVPDLFPDADTFYKAFLQVLDEDPVAHDDPAGDPINDTEAPVVLKRLCETYRLQTLCQEPLKATICALYDVAVIADHVLPADLPAHRRPAAMALFERLHIQDNNEHGLRELVAALHTPTDIAS
jgi:hypothetical protein